MQELLTKIIEMDSKARKIKEEAQTKKLESEREVEELREKIYNDYIARAKEHVEMNIAVDLRSAEAHLAELTAQVNEAKEKLLSDYAENGDRIVDEIVERVIS